MFRSLSRSLAAVTLCAGVAFLPVPVGAATTNGPIPVGKVLELFDTLDTDPESGKLLFAYFSGIAETAGTLISMARDMGQPFVCTGKFSLDGDSIQKALREAGGTRTDMRPATPIIVEDVLRRAGCE